MRWLAKKSKEKISYIGEWRVVTRFAFFPIKTTHPDASTWIWLENYRARQRCCVSEVLFDGGECWWTFEVGLMGCWEGFWDGKEL